MTRAKLYTLLLVACLVGYIWLTATFGSSNDYPVCLVKLVTNIPCPACGSTRSVIALLHGNVLSSLNWNPLGLIIALIMVAAPLWISYDVILKKASLLNFYLRTEHQLQKKYIALPLALLVLCNWCWNIYKGF